MNEAVAKALTSNDWTAGEKAVIKWQFGLWGGFYTALWNAIRVADDGNLDRLSRAYPEEIAAFRDWRHGSLGKKLRDAGLPI